MKMKLSLNGFHEGHEHVPEIYWTSCVLAGHQIAPIVTARLW